MTNEVMWFILGVVTVVELALLPFIARSVLHEKAPDDGPRCRFCNIRLEIKESKARGWCVQCDETKPSEELVSREQEHSLALKTFGEDYFK